MLLAMRALLVFAALTLAAGCAFDSHSFPEEVDPVEIGPDAAPAAPDAENTTPIEPDAAPTPPPPDPRCWNDNDCPEGFECNQDGVCEKDSGGEGGGHGG